MLAIPWGLCHEAATFPDSMCTLEAASSKQAGGCSLTKFLMLGTPALSCERMSHPGLFRIRWMGKFIP